MYKSLYINLVFVIKVYIYQTKSALVLTQSLIFHYYVLLFNNITLIFIKLEGTVK